MHIYDRFAMRVGMVGTISKSFSFQVAPADTLQSDISQFGTAVLARKFDLTKLRLHIAQLLFLLVLAGANLLILHAPSACAEVGVGAGPIEGGKYGAADVVTKKEYRDFRLHVEFLAVTRCQFYCR